MKQLGLIGKTLTHSFSKKYFSTKFEKENLLDAYHYELFPLETIDHFPKLCKRYPNLLGINVTIPYKLDVIPFLDEMSEEAKAIGAVNTIKFENGKLIGYNTDCFGFEGTLIKLLAGKAVNKALILGTGGASKAVVYVLNKLGIDFEYVSRSADKGITYDSLTKEKLQESKLIINCTPLGTFPNIEEKPSIDYSLLTSQHFLLDLIYNPSITTFLQHGIDCGASIINGELMLHLQAEKSWDIWTDQG